MKRKLWTIGLACLAILLSLGSASVAVSAESIYDLLVAELKESMKEAVNTSYLSAEKLMLGDTLTMYGQSEGVDPAKCQYAFYVRVKGLVWLNLQKYSAETVCTWTPTATADYEVCIKVKHGTKITKKYFDVRVTQPLESRAYVSTSYVTLGDSVTLTGMAEGGFGQISYGFYYQSDEDYSWTTLSDYSPASNIVWKPQRAGTYQLCIKIKDDDDQLDEKYTTLTVAPSTSKTPTSFTVTVKSPISSPYFWQCAIEDEELIGYEITDQTVMVEELKTYVLREYRFTTLSAGRTSVCLSYDTHSGQRYALNYDITVDKNLNYTINTSDGSYFDNERLPKLQPINSHFSVTLPGDTGAGRWKCEISNNLVAETDSSLTHSGEDNTFAFTVLREGHFTVTFRCTSTASMTDQYRLIYNLYADESLQVTVVDRDGYYIEDTWWPEVVTPDDGASEDDEEDTW